MHIRHIGKRLLGKGDPGRDPRIAIIGAGLGGIAVAAKLTRRGIRSFTVFEKAPAAGGTWWYNTYPGCEVDVPSMIYSYSFVRYAWSSTHAPQAELREYVEYVLDRFDLRSRIRFETGVSSAKWDAGSKAYTLELDNGDMAEFDVVVSCVGMLNVPKLPRWPGLDTFEGPVFHTARYEHQHDLSGRAVAVVGTGSTACQLVPELAKTVGRLDVYQREPGYVMPKRKQSYSAGEGLVDRWDRLRAFRRAEQLNATFEVGTTNQAKAEAFCKKYIESSIDDPEVRRAVTPTYAFGCKRPVFASDFYPALNRDNVELIPHAVVSATPDALIDDTGTARRVDAVILATGFDASSYLSTLDVYGASGRSLRDAWGDDPTAFLGVTVPGFPNFFMLFGPNTNGGLSIVAQLERQAELVVRYVQKLRRKPGRAFDTRPAIAARYDRWVQSNISTKLSALNTGCHNYYVSASGKNVTQWPLTHLAYSIALRLLPTIGIRNERG